MPHTVVTFEAATAVNAVRTYNSGYYRGRSNLDIDRAAYDRFRHGMPADKASVIDAIRFVGQDYGGAQRRFLPHGYTEEATLIGEHLLPVLSEWNTAVASAAPLLTDIPLEGTLALFFGPFQGTKRWPVWTTKTLHFLRPDAFPIMDSQAKKALGIPNLGSTPRDYARFCLVFRQTLLANGTAITAARKEDRGTSPSDLKLLDKILFELGA
jgi:hypothetical protein